MRKFWLRVILLAGLVISLAVPSALAVDLSDTSWDLGGRSRVWARSVGKAFGPASDTMNFHADPDADGSAEATFDFDATPLWGVWRDEGGRRFSGEVDETALTDFLEAFVNDATGAVDAQVTEIRVDRIWGHVNKAGDRMKMKVRLKVWFDAQSVGIEDRGAWVKLRMRGRLVDGEVTFD